MTNELFKKAKECKSAEELLALAKENGIELTAEEAAESFAALSGEGELSETELENAAGGACGGDKDYLKVGERVRAVKEELRCKRCREDIFEIVKGEGIQLKSKVYSLICQNCYSQTYPHFNGISAENGVNYERI